MGHLYLAAEVFLWSAAAMFGVMTIRKVGGKY